MARLSDDALKPLNQRQESIEEGFSFYPYRFLGIVRDDHNRKLSEPRALDRFAEKAQAPCQSSRAFWPYLAGELRPEP